MRGGLKIPFAGAMMKRLCMFYLLAALAALLGANVATAEEQGASVPVEQQGKVLGQPDTPPAASVPTSGSGAVHSTQTQPSLTQRQQAEAPANEAKQRQDAQALFQESLKQMMPLDEGQIQEFLERSDQRERALLPVSPSLNSRTVRVPLEPGRAPVKVFTTANVATSLVIYDSSLGRSPPSPTVGLPFSRFCVRNCRTGIFSTSCLFRATAHQPSWSRWRNRTFRW